MLALPELVGRCFAPDTGVQRVEILDRQLFGNRVQLGGQLVLPEPPGELSLALVARYFGVQGWGYWAQVGPTGHAGQSGAVLVHDHPGCHRLEPVGSEQFQLDADRHRVVHEDDRPDDVSEVLAAALDLGEQRARQLRISGSPRNATFGRKSVGEQFPKSTTKDTL